jgi:hypothetical protein
MELYINSIPLIVGFYLIIFSQVCSTTNFLSGLLFRTLPLILGLLSVFSGMKLFNVI